MGKATLKPFTVSLEFKSETKTVPIVPLVKYGMDDGPNWTAKHNRGLRFGTKKDVLHHYERTTKAEKVRIK